MSPEETTKELFRRFAAKDAPEKIAALFSENADWYVAGDTEVVPWIGRKTGRVGVADFWRQIEEHLDNQHFTISDFLSNGTRIVVIGELESKLRATGRLIPTESVFDLQVVEEEITRFLMFEDTHAVAQAFVGSQSTPPQSSTN